MSEYYIQLNILINATSFFLFPRSIREAWIRSKYIQKAFVSKLPGIKGSGTSKIQSWSVRKRTKRSPGRLYIKDDNSPSEADEKLENTSDLMKGMFLILNIIWIFFCNSFIF